MSVMCGDGEARRELILQVSPGVHVLYIGSMTDTRDHVQPVHRCALRERFMEEYYTVRVEALDSDPECENTLYWGGSDHDSPPPCKVRSMTCFNRVKCRIEWREKTFYLKDCTTWMRFIFGTCTQSKTHARQSGPGGLLRLITIA